MCVYACVRACVCVCVGVRACVRACACVRSRACAFVRVSLSAHTCSLYSTLQGTVEELAKLTKKVSDVEVTTNIRLQKGADSLADTAARLGLVEEFLPSLTLRADHEKLADAVDDFRWGGGGGCGCKQGLGGGGGLCGGGGGGGGDNINGDEDIYNDDGVTMTIVYCNGNGRATAGASKGARRHRCKKPRSTHRRELTS